MSMTISLKKFRAAVDKIKDPRDSALIKFSYLMAARNSEILTKTSPWDFLHNASKPYGTFLKWSFEDYEVRPATEEKPAVMEKVFLITSAVAKRGKTMKKQSEETTIELEKKEVIEALMKFNQKELLEKWETGEVEIDPLLIKALLGRIILKTVALPCSRLYEPWTLDILKFFAARAKKKKANDMVLGFDITRKTFWQLLRENLPEIFPKKSNRTIKNVLRHYRITHLISYYTFQPYDISAITGWSLRTSYSGLGVEVSPMLDHYAHLSWRNYFPKLLKPLNQFTK